MTKTELIEFISTELDLSVNRLKVGERVIDAPEDSMLNKNEIGYKTFGHELKEKLLEYFELNYDEELVNTSSINVVTQILFCFEIPIQ